MKTSTSGKSALHKGLRSQEPHLWSIEEGSRSRTARGVQSFLAGVLTQALLAAIALAAEPAHALVYDFLPVTTNATSGTFTSTNGNGYITATTAGSYPMVDNNAVYASYFPNLFAASGVVPGYITQYDNDSTNTTTFDLSNYNLTTNTVFGIWNMTEETNTYSVWTLAGNTTNAPPFLWSLLGYDDDAMSGNIGWVHIVLNPATGGISMVPFASHATDSDGAFWTNIPPATSKIVVSGHLAPAGTNGEGGRDGVVYYFAEPRPCEMTCQSNITITICGTGTNVYFPTPTLGGNCGSSTPVLVSDLSSGSIFPLGTNVVVWAVPGYPNATCSFKVIVLNSDTNPPVIVCPSDMVVFTCGTSAVATYTATASDDSTNVTVSYSSAPGSAFPLGTNQVTCTATDGCGNTTSCAFNVIVKQYPFTWSVICPSESTSINVTGCPPVMPSLTNLVTITNQCPIPGGLDISQIPAAGTVLSAGLQQVTLTVCATNGNCSNCLVSVNATISSGCCTMVCPTNLTVTTCGSSAAASYPTPSVNGPCSSNTTVVCVPASGSSFPLGTNTVTCLATNGAGIILASCSFTVTVVKSAFSGTYDFLPVTITGAGGKFISPNGNGVITVTNTGGPFLSYNNTVWSSKFTNLFLASGTVQGWIAQADNNAVYTNTFYLSNYALSTNTVFGIWNMTEETNTYSIRTFAAGNIQNAPVFTWNLLGYDDDALAGNIGWVHIVLNAGSGAISMVPFAPQNTDSDAAFWTNIPPATIRIVVTGSLGAANADGVVFYFAEPRPCPVVGCPFCGVPLTATILGANIVLSWRQDATNYVLEETSELAGPLANWTPVTNSPAAGDGEYHVMLPTEDPQRYFRLKQVPAP